MLTFMKVADCGSNHLQFNCVFQDDVDSVHVDSNCICVCCILTVTIEYIKKKMQKAKHLHFVYLLETKQERDWRMSWGQFGAMAGGGAGGWGHWQLHGLSQQPSSSNMHSNALHAPLLLPLFLLRRPAALSPSLARSFARSPSSRLNCVNGLEIVFAPCAA